MAHNEIGRTEALNIRIRPELKKGVKLLFKGKRISDSFEELVSFYIDAKIESYNSLLKANESVLKELMYRKAKNEGIATMETAVNDSRDDFNKLGSIRKTCFRR